MRSSVCPVLVVVLSATSLSATHPKLTDAEMDGLKGAVKSVSTTIERFGKDANATDHPVILYSVWCEVCEYDEQGNSVKRGQNFEGRFVGNTTRYVHNEDGTICEKVLLNEKGQVYERTMLGPFGMTERDDYVNDVLQYRQTFRYDENGNQIEWLTFNANGKQTASTTATFDDERNVTEQFDRSSGSNFLHFTQHVNPDTGVETFTNYNEDGTVRLTYTAKGSKITNFWQQPGSKHEYGSGVCFNTVPKERECEHHYPDDKVWHQFERFADERRHDPLRVELRDETGLPQMLADYEYDRDSSGNWIRRSIWLWRSDSGERKLYEVDTRTLTYWK